MSSSPRTCFTRGCKFIKELKRMRKMTMAADFGRAPCVKYSVQGDEMY